MCALTETSTDLANCLLRDRTWKPTTHRLSVIADAATNFKPVSRRPPRASWLQHLGCHGSAGSPHPVPPTLVCHGSAASPHSVPPTLGCHGSAGSPHFVPPTLGWHGSAALPHSVPPTLSCHSSECSSSSEDRWVEDGKHFLYITKTVECDG